MSEIHPNLRRFAKTDLALREDARGRVRDRVQHQVAGQSPVRAGRHYLGAAALEAVQQGARQRSPHLLRDRPKRGKAAAPPSEINKHTCAFELRESFSKSSVSGHRIASLLIPIEPYQSLFTPPAGFNCAHLRRSILSV